MGRVRCAGKLLAVGTVGALVVCGCGRDVPAAETGSTSPLNGVQDCQGAGDTIAVFWGSDQGVGWAGEGPQAATAGDVWSMSADGAMRALTHDGRSRDPWLSADSQKVYFTRGPGGIVADAAPPGNEVWLMDLTAGVESQLFTSSGDNVDVNHPEGSPDGTAVAFDLTTGSPANQRVWILDLTSGQSRDVPFDPADPSFQGQQEPTWSPDGSLLAYIHTSVRESDLMLRSSIHVFDLATMEDTVLFEGADPGGLRNLEWMPDGESLLVTQLDEEGEGEADAGEVAVEVELTGAESHVLATGIAFEATYAGPGELKEIGASIADLRSPDGRPPVPKLTTWSDGVMSVEELNGPLAFATGLNIANCAFWGQP